MRFIGILIALFSALSSGSGAFAHEFWLSPDRYTVPAGGQLVANIRVGQNFKGAAYSYIPHDITRFDVVMGDGVVKVEGRMGDRPALDMKAPGEGLAIVVHETDDSKLTYKDGQKFVDFVKHKAFPGVLEAHRARGLPQDNFKETYRRFAKALIAVGDGAGADRQVGLATEIVALANPFTDDLSGGMPVQVFLDGAPKAHAQVEVFAKDSEGEVEVTIHKADDAGKVTLPMKPGTEYLIDSVTLVPLEAKDIATDAVWHSMWAALTFKTP